jgi:hypothetical protein
VAVNPADYAAISDHIGRYCWAFDHAEGEAFAALWTDDGVASGGFAEPVVGRKALKTMAERNAGANIRHTMSGLHCDYADGLDAVRARYYNLVTKWPGGGALLVIGDVEATLVRQGAGWLVARCHVSHFR